MCALRGDNCGFCYTMVQHLIHVTSDYEARLVRSDYVPTLSYRLRMLKDDEVQGEKHSSFPATRLFNIHAQS